MRNFVLGLVLGVLATYWYLTQGDSLRLAVEELWERASSPPVAPRGPGTGRPRP